MTNKEAIKFLKEPRTWEWLNVAQQIAIDMAIDALSQQPCEDAISRQAAQEGLNHLMDSDGFRDSVGYVQKSLVRKMLVNLPPVQPKPKIGHCKDCKWWKDSDGVYRRGINAESKCSINRKEVMEGRGYCFLFEPQEN